MKMSEKKFFMKKNTRENVFAFGIVILFFIVVKILSAAGVLTSSLAGQLIPMCAYAIMAVSLNLTVGILGELSLGHAGFMSVGAFAGVLVYTNTAASLAPWQSMILALLAGAVAAGLFGLLVGIPVLRLSGDYLAIVTLAFGEIIKNLLNAMYLGLDSAGLHISFKDAGALKLLPGGKILINGALGITGIKKSSTFTLGIILLLITLAVILNLIHSRAGRAIMSIRDNEIAAQSIGINLTKYKLMAFVTSSVFAGIAGVLYALNYSTLVATKFNYNTSIQVLVFVVLGGMGSIGGSIVAAAVLTVLPEVLRVMKDYRMLIYSIALIVMMIFNQGPALVAWRKRFIAKVKANHSHDTEGKEAD